MKPFSILVCGLLLLYSVIAFAQLSPGDAVGIIGFMLALAAGGWFAREEWK